MPALRFATVSSGLVERHRADPTGPDWELLPAFAVVAAREEPSLGQPGEQPFGGRDERVRHRVEWPRQPLLDPLPGPGALPAVQARPRRPAAVRLARPVRGGHVPAVGVVRVHREGPAITVLAAALGGLPVEAAVPAPGRSAARGLVRAPLRVRVPGQRVHVALGSRAMVGEALAAVVGVHEPTELDPNQEPLGPVWIRRDPPHVGGPGARWEAPRVTRGDRLERLELGPALAVGAPE